MLSAVGGAPSDVPAVTSVPVSAGFPPIPAAAAVGSPQQPSYIGIKPEPAGDTALVRPICPPGKWLSSSHVLFGECA